jgi:hypothetical protein
VVGFVLEHLSVFGLTLSALGLPSDPIQIESVEFSPDPPKPGEDLTVKVKATAIETIEVCSPSVQLCPNSD